MGVVVVGKERVFVVGSMDDVVVCFPPKDHLTTAWLRAVVAVCPAKEKAYVETIIKEPLKGGATYTLRDAAHYLTSKGVSIASIQRSFEDQYQIAVVSKDDTDEIIIGMPYAIFNKADPIESIIVQRAMDAVGKTCYPATILQSLIDQGLITGELTIIDYPEKKNDE